MTSTSARPRDEYADKFAEAANDWDLKSLYEDLESAKQLYSGEGNRKRLTDLEKACLRGLLCGYSPDNIASELIRGAEGLRVDLSNGLYRYVKMLTGREATSKIKNWRNISIWLEEKEYKQPQMSAKRQDWGESPDVSVGFYGRTEELGALEKWIVKDRCRVVAMLGMTGIGKTALSAKLARQVREEFEYVIWRSLQNAPSVADLLTGLIQFLSSSELPSDRNKVDELISELLGHLRGSRCLLIFDNWETILSRGDFAGHYKEEYRDYSKLLKRAEQESHQSCLVLTSCEKPKEIALLEGETLPVRSLLLEGLGQDARQILNEKSLLGENQWSRLINLYRGNPLALKMVSTTIQESFNKKVDDFVLQSLTVGVMDINETIQRQLERVSTLEKKIMYWLALKRERVSRQELRGTIPCSTLDLNEALKSLGWRSLIEKVSGGFTLQPAVMQCVSHQLVGGACQEIFQASQSQDLDRLKLIQSYPLCGSQSPDNPESIKATPILSLKIKEKLLAGSDMKNDSSIPKHIYKIIAMLEERSPEEFGYAKTNLQNLASIIGDR